MKIKRWLKTYGLGFFSDRIAKDAPQFGFGGIFLSLVLSFLFILFGYYGADVAPFSTHYNKAGSYKEFIHSAFYNGVELTIENHIGTSGKIINTYTNEEDAAYKKNGYNLIVDIRPSDTLIEFEQVAIRDGNSENKISYEEYLALDKQTQKEYKLAVGFSDKLLEITPEMTTKHTAYMEQVSDETSARYDKTGAEDYKKLKENKSNYGEDEYAKEVYYLYVKYYYTGVESTLSRAKAPVLRDYYYANFVAGDNAYYFYVFDDMCAGSFETDNGVPVVFGGYFKKCENGKVTDIDAFIQEIYYDTTSYTFISYFASTVSQLFTLVLAPLIITLLAWGIGKAVKNGWEKSFAGCYKIINVFVWVTALITALILFIGGFITSARLMYKFIPVIFGGILLIRTAIYCTVSAVKNRKELKASKAVTDENIGKNDNSDNDSNEDIFDGIL